MEKLLVKLNNAESPFIINNWKAYYINLDSREDRKKLVEAEFKKIGVEAERFSALKDSDFEKFPNLKLGVFNKNSPHTSDGKKPKRKLFSGEWGCAFSHYSILKKHLESGSKNILAIFEDDAHFCTDFSDRLKYLENNFDLDWDIFYLGCFCKLIHDKETETKYVWQIKDMASGTHAMLINPKSIRAILKNIEFYAPNVSAIDNLYTYLVPSMKLFCFIPGCVSQSTLTAGDIDGRINLNSIFVGAYGEHIFAENLNDYNYKKSRKLYLLKNQFKYECKTRLSSFLGKCGRLIKNLSPRLYLKLKLCFKDIK